MLRHIYRVQQNPATVFQKQTPSRTTTADVAINLTTEKSENAEKTEAPEQHSRTGTSSSHLPKPGQPMKSPLRSTHSPDLNKLSSNTQNKNKKLDQSESVPFSAVILICLVFCILAIVGFVLLFALLYKGNATESAQLMSSAEDIIHIAQNIGMETRLL
jgi:cobalamin biosynthesis Mg chelatase CobN